MHTRNNDLWKTSTEETSLTWTGRIDNLTLLAWRGIIIKINIHGPRGGRWNPYADAIDLTLSIEDKVYNYKVHKLETEVQPMHEISNGICILTFLFSGNTLILKQRLAHEKIRATLKGEYDFQIFVCDGYESHTHEPYKLTIEKDTVELYYFDDMKVCRQICARFYNDTFTLDQWILGTNYEDEKYINVRRQNLPALVKSLQLKDDDTAIILQRIFEMFKGGDAYHNFEKYLRDNNVEYDRASS